LSDPLKIVVLQMRWMLTTVSKIRSAHIKVPPNVHSECKVKPRKPLNLKGAVAQKMCCVWRMETAELKNMAEKYNGDNLKHLHIVRNGWRYKPVNSTPCWYSIWQW